MIEINREVVLNKIVDLVLNIEVVTFRGEAFSPNLTEAVVLLKKTICDMGHEFVPILKKKYNETGDHLLIELLGIISDPQTLSFLIHSYEHADFMSGMVALTAIRNLGVNEAYEYINNLLSSFLRKETHIKVLSTSEIVVMCNALGEWMNPIAIETLKEAISIDEFPEMPKAAINALANFKQAHEFLNELASQEPKLSTIIQNALDQY
ncbi:MAG: hypothetical protein KC421_25755 [Anaerolineales bacterium]|nr:hypothetical protein [Anaerolineales bacterium]